MIASVFYAVLNYAFSYFYGFQKRRAFIMETETDYWIWTIALSRSRYARDMGIPLIDITVKSGIKAFAPTWENLRAYRAGELTKEEYARAYYDKVLHSFREDLKEWEALEFHHNVAFGCYCKPGDFCHRHFFAPLVINYLQSKEQQVQFKGELIPHVNNKRFYSLDE